MNRSPNARMVAWMRENRFELKEAYRQEFGTTEPPPPEPAPPRPPTVGLTDKQGELLLYLFNYGIDRGQAPTFAEMMAALGLKSKCSVHRLLAGLEERGRIRRLPNRARAIEIVEARP